MEDSWEKAQRLGQWMAGQELQVEVNMRNVANDLDEDELPDADEHLDDIMVPMMRPNYNGQPTFPISGPGKGKNRPYHHAVTKGGKQWGKSRVMFGPAPNLDLDHVVIPTQEKAFYWNVINNMNLPIDLGLMGMRHVFTLINKGNLDAQDTERVLRLSGINSNDDRAPIHNIMIALRLIHNVHLGKELSEELCSVSH